MKKEPWESETGTAYRKGRKRDASSEHRPYRKRSDPGGTRCIIIIRFRKGEAVKYTSVRECEEFGGSSTFFIVPGDGGGKKIRREKGAHFIGEMAGEKRTNRSKKARASSPLPGVRRINRHNSLGKKEVALGGGVKHARAREKQKINRGEHDTEAGL